MINVAKELWGIAKTLAVMTAFVLLCMVSYKFCVWFWSVIN